MLTSDLQEKSSKQLEISDLFVSQDNHSKDGVRDVVGAGEEGWVIVLGNQIVRHISVNNAHTVAAMRNSVECTKSCQFNYPRMAGMVEGVLLTKMFDPQIVYNSLQPRARSSSDHLMYQMEMNLASNRSRVGDELCRLATSQPISNKLLFFSGMQDATHTRSSWTVTPNDDHNPWQQTQVHAQHKAYLARQKSTPSSVQTVFTVACLFVVALVVLISGMIILCQHQSYAFDIFGYGFVVVGLITLCLCAILQRKNICKLLQDLNKDVYASYTNQ
ncbi:unnamed protein product [Toxocara canis]|uniref:Ac81-like protein n=1 Tax=Toxocara canis TaxID=6265 RepID=A0A183V106_TOXCA|nr:unnamed protein product [Toxocara canis]